MKGIENILRSASKAYERAQKPGVRMHAGPVKAYERAEKPRVRMHASPVKAYERAQKPMVRMHASPAKESRLHKKQTPHQLMRAFFTR